MSREAMQQALEALEQWKGITNLIPGSAAYAIIVLKQALAEPEQEPVAIVVSRQYEDGSHAGNLLEWSGRNEADDFPVGTKFYTAPPQRRPLMDEELRECWDQVGNNETVWAMRVQFARAIEAAHGITGEQHE